MQKLMMSFFVALSFCPPCPTMAQDHQTPQTSASEERLKRLETKLDEALKRLERTQAQVESLTAEVTELRAQLSGQRITARAAPLPTSTPPGAGGATASAPGQPPGESRSAFARRILDPGQGEDERQHELSPRPEIFVQTRYSTWPEGGATIADIESNFRVSRMEMRWSGRLNQRMGLGLEIQYQSAPDGSAEELVNDAFIEYYLGDHATFRVGQFVKPFGFDIQQSSSVRESPERAMFAEYFFPGERDRGALLFGDLDFLSAPALRHVHYAIGVFNGNRFFTDSDRQVNYLFRLRKRFQSINLAAGMSVQLGHQLLPPGVGGNDDENVFGVDVQLAQGRFGLRGEFAAGNRPSTLLGLEPEFAPAFRPGRHSSGGAVFATYQLTERDNIYARYDQFNGDPVTGSNVRAFNFGYFRSLGDAGRIGLDYQFKNRVSFNDDAVNTRLHITWNITF